MLTQIAFWVLATVVLTWLYLRKKYSYFKKHGINHLPTLPFFGNTFGQITKQKHALIGLDDSYRAFPDDKIIGNYEFINPVVIIRDLELIKRVGVKDFDNFTDHRVFTSKNQDDFFSKSLFGMKGQKWREMRSTLSPAFTASKLRSMVPFMQDCAKSTETYLVQELGKANDGYLDMDARDLLTRYANDVIATCAFGLKIDSVSQRNNEFYVMGKEMTQFSFFQFIKALFMTILPTIAKLIGVEIFSKRAILYFKSIFSGTMKSRDENNIFRPDILQLLMDAKKGIISHDKNAEEEKDTGFATVQESEVGKSVVKEVWDEDHILAQGLLFFFAGFETVSTAMVFLLLELAINEDVQQRLQQEIDDTLAKYNDKLDYDKINQMKYLDMCVSEILRKWPAMGFVDRICNKTYNIGSPNKNAPEYVIPANTFTVIPVFSIHRDGRYYPNPEKFDPERFSEENKVNIRQFSYLPFGVGPRNCIGSRFALIEIKTMIIALLKNFNVKPSPTTKIPLELDKSVVNMRIEGGDCLRFYLRKKNL